MSNFQEIHTAVRTLLNDAKEGMKGKALDKKINKMLSQQNPLFGYDQVIECEDFVVKLRLTFGIIPKQSYYDKIEDAKKKIQEEKEQKNGKKVEIVKPPKRRFKIFGRGGETLSEGDRDYTPEDK